jgi:hypothetical protein
MRDYLPSNGRHEEICYFYNHAAVVKTHAGGGYPQALRKVP